jgi:hypothetical protein
VKDVLGVLQSVAEVAHWTVWPDDEASGEELACPPIITWRHKRPSNELAEFFRSAVGSFRGAVAWEFSDAGRKWVLMPARVREYAEAHGCAGGLSAAAELKVTEPDFGKRANADLPSLAEHIQRHLELTRQVQRDAS